MHTYSQCGAIKIVVKTTSPRCEISAELTIAFVYLVKYSTWPFIQRFKLSLTTTVGPSCFNYKAV